MQYREHPGRSGNNVIDYLEFSRHIRTRLNKIPLMDIFFSLLLRFVFSDRRGVLWNVSVWFVTFRNMVPIWEGLVTMCKAGT